MFRKLYFNLLYLFSEPPWDTGISPPELLDFIENHPPGNAIDIGCGTGTNVITLAKAGWQVTGVDFAPHAIKLAKRKIKQAGIKAEILERSATDLYGITGPFDLALDIGCFHSLREGKAGYLSELERILAPGGHWLMYGFFRSDDPEQTGPGLTEADLGLVPASISQIWRQNGFDRGGRTSAWFLYQKIDHD
jgi:cyclopropane fatty-acyl-phospholipid synthase-like methyltransferase